MGPVILVDDEVEVRASISQTLELEGCEVMAVAHPTEALDHLTRDWPGIVISDLRMPKMDGLAFQSKVMEIDPELPFIIVTGHGDIPLAVQAMRSGAYDFVEKTADPERLIGIVRRAMDRRRLELENRALRRKLDSAGELERRIIGKTPIMEDLRQTICNLADTDAEVLIVGETGTGKEVVARCLHEFGARAGRPFVALNCGALPENVIESELFGHEAGAFTGATKRRIGKIEYADGGTLFLDEIESMPASIQVRMLRVLQERSLERLGGNTPISVDIRVMAASKIDLRAAADAGSFREDLYYRLHVANIALPPLRARRDDIPLLFHHFADLAAARYRRPVPDVLPSLTQALVERAWPGNVRELRNTAERLVLGVSGSLASAVATDEEGVTLAERMAGFEKATIAAALRDHGGRVGETAEALGLPRKTLYLRMQKHNLDRDEYR